MANMRRHKFKIIDKLECFSQNPVMIKCTIFIKACNYPFNHKLNCIPFTTPFQ